MLIKDLTLATKDEVEVTGTGREFQKTTAEGTNENWRTEEEHWGN